MDAYDVLITSPDNWVSMLLEPGEMQFVNNYHALTVGVVTSTPSTPGGQSVAKRRGSPPTCSAPATPERYQRVGATSDCPNAHRAYMASIPDRRRVARGS